MFKKIAISLAAAAVLSSAAYSGSAAAKRITIGSNPQGSVYYLVAGGLAKLLTDELKVQAVVQPYAGSSVYLPLVSSQEVTLGLSSNLDSGLHYRGESGAPLPDLRTIARLWSLPYAFMTRASDGIETVADLKGKKVAVEIRANYSLALANRAMLAAAGLSEDDVQSIDIGGLPQGVQGVSDGSIDATGVAVGIPLTRQAHATVAGGISYPTLSGPNATTAFLDQQLPGLFVMTVEPSPNRPGIDKPTAVAGIDIFIQASAELPDEQVQRILTAIKDNFAQLQKDYPVLRSASVEQLSAATNTTPYHPAAIAFFKEQGMWSEENAQREAGFER